MHLLAAKPGVISDGTEAIDLGQTPGDIVFITAADTEIAGIAAARARLGDSFPSVRAANYLQLMHNLSVDLYVDDIVATSRLVVLRLLGGVGYWPYGVERIAGMCRRNRIKLAVVPGDDQPDSELARLSTLDADSCHRLWQYCVHGGSDNAVGLLSYAASLIGHDVAWVDPRPLLRAGPYWPGDARHDLETVIAHWVPDAPTAAIVFYRALMQAATTAPVDSLIRALSEHGINPLPLFVHSLKEPVSAAVVDSVFRDARPDIILNATGFAVSSPGGDRKPTPFDGPDCPILQVVFAGMPEAAWRAAPTGLGARDIAMNVALPEVDGRILSRAVSFKTEARFDTAIECAVVAHEPLQDRIDFTAALAARWIRLARKPRAERRVALVLANYPNRDGRLGNGVGLDTPASTVTLLRALRDDGYAVDDIPPDGNALVRRLLDGPTNALDASRQGGEALRLTAYWRFFETLPGAVRRAVSDRWGRPENDPFFSDGAFRLAVQRLGNCVVAVQPARGYNIDPAASYHDPDLVPPHGYLAFYLWLRDSFDADAVLHMGKHGNLEWLPGKSLALSAECYPEAVFGPLPHIYPFIVNDPGEGTQAKRRASAVIVDHLTPPLTRAESYGPLAELERLVDEYYEAAGIDPRRLDLLRGEILELTERIGLDKDCGVSAGDDSDAALAKLDNYLCELKEMQIRDGLHVFGVSPAGLLLTNLLVALTRIPRGDGKGGEASIIRALARDLGFADFDPLDCDLGGAWDGARPAVLAGEGTWRTNGDTVERLEHLAAALVAGDCTPEDSWTATRPVLDAIDITLRPAVRRCGGAEIDGTLRALDGRFLSPGPSGAPTRGRPEVLPTGRNFYSVDTRSVPTPAAWQLGWKSAALLIERHRQEHGDWPRRMALSAWGTSNMRTGGDDIAQGLALMGVRPRWDQASGRVTGFEIMPLSVLDRPRVDVTFRLSGFFRDAFSAQIELLDSVVGAVAELDEAPGDNPLAARVTEDIAILEAEGASSEDARRRATYRLFGSKPGAYGAGLQALIDERGWEDGADLARAYVAWGGYAYGAGIAGVAEHRLFEARLGAVDTVLHNQDNREHDLLDSDDYYQFEGGLAAAVAHHSGRQPVVYHNDHSRPETPRIRTLEEEIGRVVRARVVNPKWIAGVMRHGYKGAFEMAATVDYMFAFAATTGAVRDHHFDLVCEAYLEDADVRAFLEANNPHALKDIAARLAEAQDRGLWRPRSNRAYRMLEELAGASS